MKKRRILLLVHIEDVYRSNFGEGYLVKLRRAIKRQDYDEVIHFTSEVEDDHPVEELRDLVTREITWGFGYEKDMFAGAERRWLINPYPYSVHRWTWVPPALRELVAEDVELTIGGGFDRECLGNLEASLVHLKLPYKKPKSFVFPSSARPMRTRRPLKKQEWVFYTNCVNSDGPSITEMVRCARAVTYTTLRRQLGSAFRELQRELGYDLRSTKGVTMRKDWHVSYAKSRFRGVPCYYVGWSGIEHVFVPADMVQTVEQRRPEFVPTNNSILVQAFTSGRRTIRRQL